jgi:hypothetical protein
VSKPGRQTSVLAPEIIVPAIAAITHAPACILIIACTGTAVGPVTVKATATDGSGISGTETITVKPAQTPTPTIATPIYAGATSVSGTAAANTRISLTVNGGTAKTTTASAAGN